MKRLHVSRVFNDYDFGGYLIADDVPTFIDGRTELFGEKLVGHHLASELIEPDQFFTMLNDYKIEATLLRTQSAAAKLLDHRDGWRKIYDDGTAAIHLCRPGAVHLDEPAISSMAQKNVTLHLRIRTVGL